MPILKNITKPNGAPIGFHKAITASVDYTASTVVVQVASWPDAASHDAGYPLDWMQPVVVPIDRVADAEAAMTELSTPFSGGSVVADNTGTLDAAKTRKNAEINSARLTANQTTFSWNSKDFACDVLSRSDIDAIQGYVARNGTLPAEFPGGWKAVDNSVVAIPDATTWDSFYNAMVQTGTNNFNHAQDLKNQLAAATTIDQVNAITWG